MNGYQILEPEFLSRLVQRPNQFDFAVALLHWIVQCLKEELGGQMDRVDIDVIPVKYLGSYPALGIRYGEQNAPDLEPMIRDHIERIVRTRSALELIQSVAGCDARWNQLAAVVR